MQRVQQLIFVVSLLALSWLVMMAVHELGHVFGAWFTGGTVKRVVLHPLTISQTDVEPNLHPLIVVWLGPLVGILLPVIVWLCIPVSWNTIRPIAQFFAGFCLIANGAYIGIGSIDQIGDCGVMLQNGSPMWTLLLFGIVSAVSGLYLWHRLGSLKDFLWDASQVDKVTAYTLLALLVVVAAIELIGFI